MKNIFAEKNLKLSQVVLAVWLVFSILFVGFSLWNSGLKFSYDNGYNTAFSQVVQRSAANCEPFPVRGAQGEVQLINIACLQQAPAEGGEAAPAEATQ